MRAAGAMVDLDCPFGMNWLAQAAAWRAPTERASLLIFLAFFWIAPLVSGANNCLTMRRSATGPITDRNGWDGDCCGSGVTSGGLVVSIPSCPRRETRKADGREQRESCSHRAWRRLHGEVSREVFISAIAVVRRFRAFAIDRGVMSSTAWSFRRSSRCLVGILHPANRIEPFLQSELIK
jgi:hypothetical protein